MYVKHENSQREKKSTSSHTHTHTHTPQQVPLLLAEKKRFELESSRCTEWERVWTSRGTPCEKPLSIWRMELSKSKMRFGGSYSKKFSFGHVARPGYHKPSSKDDFPALLAHISDHAAMRAPGELRTYVPHMHPTHARSPRLLTRAHNSWMNTYLPHPVAYRLAWHVKTENSTLYVWRPVPPSDIFTGVGIVATTDKQVCALCVLWPILSCTLPTPPQEPPLDEVRCFPVEWCVKAAPQFMWEETNLGEHVKVWAGNGFGSCAFQTAGHPLAMYEPRPGKWYADAEGAGKEAAKQKTKEERPFGIIAARLTSQEERNGTTYYVIEVSPTEGKPWKVFKRYNMFFDLRARCKDLGHDTACHFPSKSILRVSGEALEERRKALDWYMTEIVDKAKQTWGGALQPLLTEFLQLQQAS